MIIILCHRERDEREREFRECFQMVNKTFLYENNLVRVRSDGHVSVDQPKLDHVASEAI